MNRLFRYGCWGIAWSVLPTGCVRVAPQTTASLFWDQPAKRHPPETAFDGAVVATRPRLVFKPAGADGPGRTFAEVRALRANDSTFRAIFDKALTVPGDAWHPAMAAACWIATEDDAHAERAIRQMLTRRIRRSGSGYSNIWTFALAYDWLYEHPAMTPGARAAIEYKLAERLATELDELDGQGMALWHGRNQAANNAMIAALAIGDRPRYRELLRRATAHYADSLRALAHTEAWPEGASYWIYNRAGPYAIAADCFMTAFGTDKLDGLAIRDIMKRIGYWQIYQFGPNETFEPYGDSQGSLRLGDTGWWELTTDYFARLSGDPGVMAGADHIRNRSPLPYGKRPYYWHVTMTYDPSVRPSENYDPARPELWMRTHLPQSMLFGRRSMGLVFLRGRWGDPDETYAVFHAGDYFTHHEHYDVGHFGIQKGGWLAPRTGLIAPGYTSDHRLGYFTQTVSANSLLVLAPDETSAYLSWRGRGRGWAWLSGGQRAIRPTGFICANFEHFQELLHSGPHLKRADITAFESVPGLFDYVAADITAAYNSTVYAEPDRAPKLSRATRSFLYLRPLDVFVVYDRIETLRAEYQPKFLLHHLDKPGTESERLLAGNGPDDGILETPDRLLVSKHRRGRLEHHVLLPEAARVLKIGGPNHYAYVEHTGTQADGFSGTNLVATGVKSRNRGPTFTGEWRTEVEPAESGTSARFLNVLVARLRKNDPMPTPSVRVAQAGPAAHAAAVGDWVAVFAREPAPLTELELDLAEPARVLILDAIPNRIYRAGDRAIAAGNEGVLDLDRLPAGRHAIRAAEESEAGKVRLNAAPGE